MNKNIFTLLSDNDLMFEYLNNSQHWRGHGRSWTPQRWGTPSFPSPLWETGSEPLPTQPYTSIFEEVNYHFPWQPAIAPEFQLQLRQYNCWFSSTHPKDTNRE